MGMTDIERKMLKSGGATVLSGRVVMPDLADLPVRVPRAQAAELLTKYYFRTSGRSLERWPIGWRLLNGRAHCEVAELFALAEAILANTPSLKGGKASARRATV